MSYYEHCKHTERPRPQQTMDQTCRLLWHIYCFGNRKIYSLSITAFDHRPSYTKLQLPLYCPWPFPILQLCPKSPRRNPHRLHEDMQTHIDYPIWETNPGPSDFKATMLLTTYIIGLRFMFFLWSISYETSFWRRSSQNCWHWFGNLDPWSFGVVLNMKLIFQADEMGLHCKDKIQNMTVCLHYEGG